MYNIEFENRKKVMEDTIEVIHLEYDEYGKYSESVVIENPDKIPNNIDRSKPNTIIVESIDCIKCAEKLENPLVLNMASYINPGGGCMKGSMAQEEELFRRTTISLSLFRYHKDFWKYYERDSVYNLCTYPLDGISKCIYSNTVDVIKKDKSSNYEYLDLDNRFKISVLTLPAYRRYRNDTDYTKKELSDWHEKIRAIFRVAYKYNHKNLVLSAFGCGAYNNDPKIIANIFKDILNEEEFKGLFDNIYFAILDKGTLIDRDTNNYQVFKDILS